MKQLTESLLALARSDSGQESAVSAPVDLSFIVNSSLMAFEPLAFDMGKHITYDIEAALHVNGDDKKLRQLTDILLDNACKYSQDNGSICVTLKKASAKEALLTVSNEGRLSRKKKSNTCFSAFTAETLPAAISPATASDFPLPKALYLSMEERLRPARMVFRNKLIYSSAAHTGIRKYSRPPGMLQGFGLLHATAASQNMDTFRQALFRRIPCQQSLLYYNNGGFAGNISGSFRF